MLPSLLAHRLDTLLREQLEDGRYGDTLPGEPRLASQLLVSRGTLRKALVVLTEQGVITAGVSGKPRRVRGRADSGEKSGRRYRVGVLAPRALDALPTATQQFLHQLAAETATDGIVYSHHHSVGTQRQRPARWLRAMLAEDPADLWLVYEAPLPVARFFRTSGTPTIICGGPAFEEGVPYCGFDGVAALRHAIGMLSRAGHRRIIHPGRFRRPLREKTFREEFEKRGMPFDVQTHMPLWHSDIDQLRDLLSRRLDARDRPTALIINGLNALIVLYSCLMERRMTVPRDLSVLTIGSDPMMECFRPAIGYYETPYRTLARATTDMVRAHLLSPATAPAIKLLQTNFVRGGSVGKAPG